MVTPVVIIKNAPATLFIICCIQLPPYKPYLSVRDKASVNQPAMYILPSVTGCSKVQQLAAFLLKVTKE